MFLLGSIAWLTSFTVTVHGITDVMNLLVEPNFRSVSLNWQYPLTNSGQIPSAFLVTYCEDQAWGRYRCRKKRVDYDRESSRKSILNFETTLDRLRMATNYSIELNAIDDRGMNVNRGRAIHTDYILVQTKGFSAQAIRCLANSSLVEIETGPYFGGKISVEGSIDGSCSTKGDYSSPKTSYFLKIDHNVCGSDVHNSSVKSFIIVQENLPILTHSTRRFMVLCTYVPETFTVRAGVRLPTEEEVQDNNIVAVEEDVLEIDPSELFDSTNNLFSSRRSSQVGRAMKFSSPDEEILKEEPQRWSHLVLMVVMVIAAALGMAIAVWQFVYRSRKSKRDNGSPSPQPSLEESVSAGSSIICGEDLSEEGSIIFNPPPVSLVSVKEESLQQNRSQKNDLHLTEDHFVKAGKSAQKQSVSNS